MKLVGHQPEFLPWCGFWSKLLLADAWCVFDHVQYQKRYFLNRNRVLGADGPVWVRAPVLTKGRFEQPIEAVRINPSERWARKLLATLRQAYGKAPFFPAYYPVLEEILTQEWELLRDLNLELARAVMSWLDIDLPVVCGSDLPVTGRATEMIVELCLAAGATDYVAGAHGADYLEPARFAKAGIALWFHHFEHPRYDQGRRSPFEPRLSILDLVFNCGPLARAILEECGRLVPAPEFLSLSPSREQRS